MPHDPIRLVDRRDLRASTFPAGRVARLVERDLRKIARELELSGFEGFEVPSRNLIADNVSNVRAWVENESRRSRETLINVTQGPVSRGHLMEWLRAGARGNRNVFSLSVESHLRAATRLGVWRFGQHSLRSDDPMTHVGVVIARPAERSIRPRGQLSEVVGRIFPVAEWLRFGRRRGRAAGPLNLAFTLGLHHGDRSSLVPVTGSLLEDALKAFAAYRFRLLKRIRGDDR